MSAPYEILVVGVGSIGERHVRCFLGSGRARVSVCEPNADLRENVCSEYEVQESYADVLEALNGRAFDAAVICVPAHLHIPIAQQLAEAGLHLLIEKPLSTGLSGLDQLSSTLVAHNLQCVIGYTWRSHPASLAMKQAIDSGVYGSPLQVVTTSGQHFPTYRPGYLNTYYASHESGGGCIQDSLTHLLNLTEWFVGPIRAISADAAHKRLEGVGVEDMAHCMTRHGDVLGSFAQNQFQAPNETTITVACEGATLQMRTHHCDFGVMTDPDTSWQRQVLGPLGRDDTYVSQTAAFLAALDGDQPPRCTLAEGWQTLKVNLAALRSAESRCWERITE